MPPSPRSKTNRPARKNEAARPKKHKNLASTQPNRGEPVILTPAGLRRWPLPQPQQGGDKEERGRVLIVGGACEMPGAVVLAATAALRAGAGKLQIAVPASIAGAVGMAVLEARVFALPESEGGSLDPRAAEDLAELANQVNSLLVGPGLIGTEGTVKFLEKLLPALHGPVVTLDAEALSFVAAHPHGLHHLNYPVILTPHAGEMAQILQMEKEAVVAGQLAVARRAAHDLGAVVALKGAETYITAPEPEAPTYCNRSGNIGLATSGSGDTLAGIIAGLAARGATPQQAAAWGVYLHGCAGDRLAKRTGIMGFLARELLPEIPVVMQGLTV